LKEVDDEVGDDAWKVYIGEEFDGAFQIDNYLQRKKELLIHIISLLIYSWKRLLLHVHYSYLTVFSGYIYDEIERKRRK